jgi:hypothetical protein
LQVLEEEKMQTKSIQLAAIALSLPLWLFHPAPANAGSLVPVPEPTAGLPAVMGVYSTNTNACFTGGTGGTVCLFGDGSVIPASITTSISGNNELTTFRFLFAGLITDGSSNPLGTVNLNGDGKVTVFARGSDSQLGTFSTQMTQLDLSGIISGNSALGGITLMTRLESEDANLPSPPPSTGSTTVSTGPGNGFLVTSFFDVFTEISITGGSSWIQQNNAPTEVDLLASPEPGSLVLLGAGCLALALRRRLR